MGRVKEKLSGVSGLMAPVRVLGWRALCRDSVSAGVARLIHVGVGAGWDQLLFQG